MRLQATLMAVVLPLSSVTAMATDWIHLPAKEGAAKGKKIVFVTGDDEYHSESSMPMMAHILAERHGFDCRVLFAINRKSGVIDTSERDNIPGLQALADADLMVVFTRFRSLVDEQMQMFQSYLDSGKPVIGIRTSTHAFDFSKNPESRFAKYSYSNKSASYTGGFGQQVLGQNWVNHWGSHGKQGSRGRFAPTAAGHPILRGIADGEIWGPTDVYEATLPQPAGCEALVLGEVCESINPDSGPAEAKGKPGINRNDPMMPIAWTYRRDAGVKGRVFTSTMGGAMAGKDDFASEGFRRMLVNACYWTLGLEDKTPAKSDVTPVLQPNPFQRGAKPEEALARGLAALNAKDSTILFYGGSMVERLLEHGEMEARVQLAQPGKQLHFRSLAWTGDEVANRLRAEGYAAHLKELLEAWPANVIVLGYGLNESFAGAAGLPAFRTALTGYLDQLARLHPGAKFVLLSPIATEGDAARTAVVKLYADAIADAAKTRNAQFVDLFTPTAQSKVPLTSNGIHLNDNGNRAMARVIATALAGETAAKVDEGRLKEVAAAAAQLAYYTAEVVRPKNGILYYGQRKRPEERKAEMPLYMQRIEKAAALVHRLAGDPAAKFADAPFIALAPLPPVTKGGSSSGVGTVKSPAEMQAELKVADGYTLNLFASEEQFPELCAPVQIAFDARGRLWVVTMPSFPHTVPGQPQEDKIIVLEDTDHDGKADKCTTFAGGFDALDGIAFTENGALIGEQSRHWLMRDTDGDGRADTKTELLRGLDVTDSHHGGMVATDPVGGVWFSDGVFHRSQFETPFGVHRGFDASTYRMDPRTGRIETEWQNITPNPWRVTFDRTGNAFQMYGDGLVVDGLPLTWTPLGVYHPFAYASVVGYGKGSAAASIGSPNFPDEYQQGMASAACVGPYAVSLTKFDFSGGLVRGSGRVDLISSPNPAFRPVDVNFGFDGALYVSDFASAIIGHAQNPMRDARWNHTKGRIWRVVYASKPVVRDWPKIEGASAAELCSLLTHSQDIVRDHTRIELRKLGKPALTAVDAWVATKKGDDQAVLESLFVCEGLGETRPALLDALLASKSPLHRAAAVHLVRLQAARLPDFLTLLQRVANDEHPRVRMEVVDAIAHLRPAFPQVEHLTHAFHGEQNASVKQMLADLSHGTAPRLASSVPVLEMLPETRLAKWEDIGDGIFRTFLRSTAAQPAILSLKYSFLDVSLNGVQVLSFDSQWSSEQQARLELQPGLNTLEITYRKLKGAPPAVHLFSPIGGKLEGAQTATDDVQLAAFSAESDKVNATLGQALRVQAVPNLMQFAPRELRVKAGAKVRLIFDNPDLMMHNFVLVARGAGEEVGALADQLAADPNGMAKGYVPASPKVLLATPLVAPKTKAELTFDAPKEPGEYPYLCTFPGHWRVMRGVLIVSAEKPPVAPPRPKAVTMKIGAGVLFETASSENGFTTLVPPAQKSGNVSANRKTNNDPIGTLTDGKLQKGFGPIFGNGIEDGAYKMDLGKPQPVTAITSWSHHQSGTRGAQRVTLYGSASANDPGWEVADTTRFTSLGTMSTDGQTLEDFTALSRRSPDGKPLGTFQWIVWQVSPVTPLVENTAIQELAVEVAGAAKREK